MFIPEAKHFWKMASNWMFLAIAILTGIKEQWHDTFAAVVPDSWYPYLVAIIALLGILARVINQGIKRN